jgi:hypothetical protein
MWLYITTYRVLAVGVCLQVAIQMYEIPYRLWEPSPGLDYHDFQSITATGQLVKVEIRGRINRKNIGKAVDQVYQKFESGDFTSAAGVIVFPRRTKPGIRMSALRSTGRRSESLSYE